jgi:hypothetical protein
MTLVGCRGNSEAVTAEEANIDMSLSIAPDPPAVGDATLVVSLRDANGDPISDANIDILGNMSHAGMEPVEGDANTDVSGDYRVPFEWTMGGDWAVTVTARLPDGTVVEEEFTYTVVTDSDEMDMGEMDSE